MHNEKWKVVDGEWTLVNLNVGHAEIEAACPWRRYFARGFDISLYFLLWVAFAFLVLHWNVAGWNIRNGLISVALMILIEPFLLRIFGTTPGKALLGIRIRDAQGEKLPLAQGYRRVWLVFLCGYGAWIPIFNIVRLVISYRQCKKHGFMSWDRDEFDKEEVLQYTVNRKLLPLRAVAYILISVLCLGVAVILPAAADMPRHRGDLTVEQFHDNVWHYAKFHNLLDMHEQETGRFSGIRGLNVVETNGVVTEVSFEIVDGNSNQLTRLARNVNAYVFAFVGAQDGVNFWNLHISGNLLSDIFALPPFGLMIVDSWAFESFTYTAHGVEITYHLDVNGLTGNTAFMLFHQQDLPVNVRFSMRRV